MRRREFITLLGGTAATWSLSARAQQPAMPLIGFLNQGSAEPQAHEVAGFRKGLSEAGFIEGRNVAIEFRWDDGHYDRLPGLAADLASRKVAVMFAAFLPATFAAKAATSTIPIVFLNGADPVAAGFVASMNRPGGNLTGVSTFSTTLLAKRLELLHQMTPNAKVIVLLVNPATPDTAKISETVAQAAAHVLGIGLDVLEASTSREIDAAFVTLVQRRAAALLVAGDAFFNNRRDQLIALARQHSISAIYDRREIATAGGLMSYGPSVTDNYRQAAIYTAQILKGAKPADLPVVQPTRIEFVVNLKTAKSLGIEVPTSILLNADEVIE